MDHHGCLDHARRVAHALAGAACHEAEGLYAGLPDSNDRRFIEALPTWVLARA
jgi:geranylgeranyl diphosphate synthase type II